jgi:hypothetical protein
MVAVQKIHAGMIHAGKAAALRPMTGCLAAAESGE